MAGVSPLLLVTAWVIGQILPRTSVFSVIAGRWHVAFPSKIILIFLAGLKFWLSICRSADPVKEWMVEQVAAVGPVCEEDVLPGQLPGPVVVQDSHQLLGL